MTAIEALHPPRSVTGERVRSRTALVAAISAGLAFATCCFPPLAATVAALGLFAVPAVIASALLCWLVSRAYAELSGMFPTAAGVRTYVGQAFGHRAGRALALLSLVLIVAIGAAETFVLSHVLGRALSLAGDTPAMPPGAPTAPIILGFVGVCICANVVGFEPAGALQAVLTHAILGAVGALSLAVLCAGPAAGVVAPSLSAPAPDAVALLTGLASVTFLFIGFEWVVTTVEDVGDAGRALPRGMTWAIVLLGAAYALFAAALRFGVAPATLAGDLAPHVTLGAAIAGRTGTLLTVAVSIAATVTTFNSGILGASRLVYALAREGVLPRGLARMHPRFRTPWAAIVLVGAVTSGSALLLSRTGTVQVAVRAGACIECLVFAVVSLALVRLRATQPDRARPYRAPFGTRTAVAIAALFALLALAILA